MLNRSIQIYMVFNYLHSMCHCNHFISYHSVTYLDHPIDTKLKKIVGMNHLIECLCSPNNLLDKLYQKKYTTTLSAEFGSSPYTVSWNCGLHRFLKNRFQLQNKVRWTTWRKMHNQPYVLNLEISSALCVSSSHQRRYYRRLLEKTARKNHHCFVLTVHI